MISVDITTSMTMLYHDFPHHLSSFLFTNINPLGFANIVIHPSIAIAGPDIGGRPLKDTRSWPSLIDDTNLCSTITHLVIQCIHDLFAKIRTPATATAPFITIPPDQWITSDIFKQPVIPVRSVRFHVASREIWQSNALHLFPTTSHSYTIGDHYWTSAWFVA